MPQPNQNKIGTLLQNSSSPIYDSLYPNGNRGTGGGSLIARADWSLHDTTPTSIQSGATWTIYGSASASFTKVDNYLQGLYADNTSGGFSGGASIEFDNSWANLQDVFIEFDARMPGTKSGMKFCKIHNDENGTANTTYGCEGGVGPGAGDITGVSFGDGTTTGNDVANLLLLGGDYPQWIGRSYGAGAVITYKTPTPSNFSWDNNWHNFKIRHKYNSGTTSGNEVNDGIIYLMIDDQLYVSAVNIFNRHYTNGKRPVRITFGDWAQGNAAAEINFRNIKISSGGFM